MDTNVCSIDCGFEKQQCAALLASLVFVFDCVSLCAGDKFPLMYVIELCALVLNTRTFSISAPTGD